MFNMIDVGEKAVTRRRAVAEGTIRLTEEAFFAVSKNKNPKGDVLALAEVAGIQAAKKTPELIPLCHPLPLERIDLSFSMNESEYSVVARCEVLTSAKTGVEMEALSGVNGALLTIHDLSKAVNPVLTMTNIRVILKEGGKTGRWIHPEALPEKNEEKSNTHLFQNIRVATITISDRAAAGTMKDISGPAITEFFRLRGAQTKRFKVIPDEKEQIQATVLTEIREMGADLVVTTGGTGLGPRDRTPEAIEEICDYVIPGVGECLRSAGASYTSHAWLSRSIGAVIGKTIVITLPGSVKGVTEGLAAIERFLPHALEIVTGGQHGKLS